MKPSTLASRLALLGAALLIWIQSSTAREIMVTSTADPIPPAPAPDGSLRAAVQSAVKGDVIIFKGTLAILLENDLSLGEGITLQGPAELRAKIDVNDPIDVHTQRREFEVLRIFTAGVTIKDMTFRNVGVKVGREDIPDLAGFTMTVCKFTQAGQLSLENLNDALIEGNTFALTDDRSGSTGGSVNLFGTKRCVIRSNTFQNEHNAGGITSVIDEELLVEMNKGNVGFFLEPRSATIRKNILEKSRLYVASLTFPNPGSLLIEENECGSLAARGVNMVVRKNKASGKLVDPKEAQTPGVFEDEEATAVAAFVIDAGRSATDQVTLGPVLVEENEISGGTVGLALNIFDGCTLATVRKNKIEDVEYKGIVLNQSQPVILTGNMLERCGATRFRGDLPAGVHLRLILSPDATLEGNFINRSGGLGTAILTDSGSPVIKDNVIDRGKAEGLRIGQLATPVIDGNNISRMARGGIVVAEGADASMKNVTLTENGTAGILVEPGANLQCEAATIEGNKGHGVRFLGGSTGTLEGGNIRSNTGAGVYVQKAAAVDIRAVGFGGNRGAGIDLAPKGITANALPKRGNANIDFPDELEYDAGDRRIRGEAEPGSIVQLFRSEAGARTGKRGNGEGAVFLGETLAEGDGTFAISPGPAQKGDLFCLTATRLGQQPVTSEFSANIEIPPSPPIERVTVSSTGEEADNGSGDTTVDRTVSDSGRFVVFTSFATNLVPDDTNGGADVFVRDVTAGTTERVSLNSAGQEATSNFGSPSSFSPSISADGRWVVFVTDARNLLPGDTNSNFDICLHDRETGATIGVTDPAFDDTTRPVGQRKRSNGREPSMSADASVIAFVSNDGGFVPDDTNASDDIFVWTRSTGAYQRVSISTAGGQIGSGNSGTGTPRMSGDGRFVVFTTIATLVPGNTTGGTKVYLRDLQAGTTELVSVDANGLAVTAHSPAISHDGRFVVFVSAVSLVHADTNGKADLYLHDRQTGVLEFCSRTPEGIFFAGDVALPSVSADGRFIAFSGPGQSVRNGFTVLHPDIYVFDRQTGVTKEASIGVAGDATGVSGRPCLSADGRFLTFESDAENLVDNDINGRRDIFLRDRSSELAAKE
jgi:Tol biopolymer transport system component